MPISYDLEDLNDISGLSKVTNIYELHDYSGIRLNGKKLNKQQVRQLRQTIMKFGESSSNYGKIVSQNIGKAIEKKEAHFLNVIDLYASPRRWNFYEPLDDNKKLELMESIQENGILSPIIVWEVDFKHIESEYLNNEVDVYDLQGNKYMVLAGHNRVDAFNKLYKITSDEKYLKIPAFIFKQAELTIESAREIVIDTNYVQRSLSTKEKVMSVMYKYAELEKNKNKKGVAKNIVAEELGLSPTMVFNYKKLGEIIEPLQNMVYDNKVGLTSVLKLSDKSISTQQFVYDKYKDRISNKILNKIKPYMKKQEIETLFENELKLKTSPTKQVTFEIPEHLESKARKLIANLIERDKNKQ